MLLDPDVLAQSPLFSGLDHEVVSAVFRVGRTRSYAVIEALMRQGDRATCMHVIIRGRVRVVHHTNDGRSLVLAELGPGEGVGEIGLIDGEPRTATVVAIEPTETVEIDARAFTKISRTYPEFYEQLARVLSHRLRATQALLEGQKDERVAAAAIDTAAALDAKSLVVRQRELIERQDWAALEPLVARTVTYLGLPGARGIREEERSIAESLGEVTTTVRQIIAEGDWVVELALLHATRDPARPGSVGQRSFPAVFVYRIEDGKIVERIRLASDFGDSPRP